MLSTYVLIKHLDGLFRLNIESSITASPERYPKNILCYVIFVYLLCTMLTHVIFNIILYQYRYVKPFPAIVEMGLRYRNQIDVYMQIDENKFKTLIVIFQFFYFVLINYSELNSIPTCKLYTKQVYNMYIQYKLYRQVYNRCTLCADTFMLFLFRFTLRSAHKSIQIYTDITEENINFKCISD